MLCVIVPRPGTWIPSESIWLSTKSWRTKARALFIHVKKSYGRSTHVLRVTLRRKVEVVFSGGIYTEILCAKGRDVEIHLQNLPLRILLCQADGKRGLCQLAT